MTILNFKLKPLKKWKIIQVKTCVTSFVKLHLTENVKKKQQVQFVTENRFAPISPATTASELTSNQSAPTQPTSYNIETDEVQPIPAPPPIFVSNIENFIKLRTDLIDLISTKNFSFKSTSKNLKIVTNDSDAYRKVIRYLNEKQIEHHTYQAREHQLLRSE